MSLRLNYDKSKLILFTTISCILFISNTILAAPKNTQNCEDCSNLHNTYQAPITTDQLIPGYRELPYELQKPKAIPDKLSCAEKWNFFKSTYTDQNPIQSLLKSFGGDKIFEEDIKKVMRGDFSVISKYSTTAESVFKESQKLNKQIKNAYRTNDLDKINRLASQWHKLNQSILEMIAANDPKFLNYPKNYHLTDVNEYIKRSEKIDQNIEKVIRENRDYNQAQPAGKKRLLIIKTGQFHSDSYFINHRDQRTMYATRHNLNSESQRFSEEYAELLPFMIEYKKQKIKNLQKELHEYSKLHKSEFNDEKMIEIKDELYATQFNLKIHEKDFKNLTATVNLKKFNLLATLAAQYQYHGGIDKALESQIFNTKSVKAHDEILIGETHFERDIEMDKSIPLDCLKEFGYDSVMYAYEGNSPKKSGLHDFDYRSIFLNRLQPYPKELIDMVCNSPNHKDLCKTLRESDIIVRDPGHAYLIQNIITPVGGTLFYGLE